jgi:hypothetical protein
VAEAGTRDRLHFFPRWILHIKHIALIFFAFITAYLWSILQDHMRRKK